MSNDYILSNVNNEKQRMHLLEHEFDALSQRRLLPIIHPGDTCLEIGPGAGSMARWMADNVGAQGQVIAIEKHPGHFSSEGRENITLIQGDVTSPSIQDRYQNYFNVIHTRFVLVHIQECETLISQLVNMLKPGGWLVFEEPDFTTTAALDEADMPSFQTISALQKLIMRNGAQHPFARRLPYLFQDLHLANIHAEGYVPISHGSSHLTQMHYQTVHHLKDTLIDANLVSEPTLAAFLHACVNPQAWTRECQIICIRGQHQTN